MIEASCTPEWGSPAALSTKIITDWCIAPVWRAAQYGAVLSERAAANIKRLRKDKGLSQTDLARRLNPPTVYQQIDKLETGERRLTLDWIEKIAQGLQVSPMELLGSEASAWQTQLSEEVAREVARVLAVAALNGAEPGAGTVEVLAVMLREFAGIFRRYPQALTDPEIARPVLDFAAQRLASQAS